MTDDQHECMRNRGTFLTSNKLAKLQECQKYTPEEALKQRIAKISEENRERFEALECRIAQIEILLYSDNRQ